MNKKLLTIILMVLCATSVIVAIFTKGDELDSIKFKKEYESLNGTSASKTLKYSKMNIDTSNPIKYSNYDEILDVINNKTGIIYLGFPECPWCRTAIPVLLEVAKDNKIDTIYYLNILNERDSYTVEDGELVYSKDDSGKEKKGSKGYFKLLEALEEYLTDYTIELGDEVYEVGEKRIFAPTVIFVKEGKVLGIHVSTVAGQVSGFDKLTDEQHEELYSIYEDYIIDMTSSTCDIDSSC